MVILTLYKSNILFNTCSKIRLNKTSLKNIRSSKKKKKSSRNKHKKRKNKSKMSKSLRRKIQEQKAGFNFQTLKTRKENRLMKRTKALFLKRRPSNVS